MNISSFIKRTLSTIAVIVLAVGVSSPAFAAYFISQENFHSNEIINDDAYISAGYSTISATVNGDLYIAGGVVNIDGDVDEDIVVAGGMVRINGNVGGDVRVLGGQVTINGTVGDDLMVASGMVDIAKSATILGDLTAASDLLTIDGIVNGDITGVMSLLIINGTVGGNINITLEDSIQMGENAQVGGDLHYSALFETEIPAEMVAGEVVFTQFEKESIEEDLNSFYYTRTLYGFVATLLLCFIFVWFYPNALLRAAEVAKKETFKAFGAGLLMMIALFMGSLILFFTVIGIPLAAIGFALLLILFYLGRVFAVVWMSSYVFKFGKKTKRSKLFAAVFTALVAYYFIGLIPYIGMIINLILFFIGVGALVLIKVEHIKLLKSKKLL